jgi:serine/threonine-protein kinase HipA
MKPFQQSSVNKVGSKIINDYRLLIIKGVFFGNPFFVVLIEAPKLLKILIFNYLFSNGDAHFKNFSILETPFGDYRLSPAYDLLNSCIHTEDKDFALDDGLLPKNLAQGKICLQFAKLAEKAEVSGKTFQEIMTLMISKSELVEKMIAASFLNDTTKRNYFQSFQDRLKQLKKV